MLPRLPSLTAASVAVFRSLASLPGAPFDTVGDRSLRALAPRPIDAALGLLGAASSRVPVVHELARWATAGLYDHVALRTRAIDVLLCAELARGVDQLVICGAGLDARAFRLRELAGAVVFEVDHPATQRLKKARARSVSTTAREVRFVAIDFEREPLDEKLARAGHDPERPTVWIWEGVTMYLARAATRATLRVIADRSAPGSLALVTYALPEMVNVPSVLHRPIELGFTLLGEPLAGRMSREAMASVAAEVGLTVESDTGGADWAAAHLRAEPLPIQIAERLVALRRT